MVNKLRALFAGARGRGIYNSALAAIDEFSMDRLISRGVLVGLSGGADSVMLLLVLIEYSRNHGGFPIVAYHLNHSIRGAEADSDEAFSRKLCDELSVEFVSAKMDIPAIAKENGEGIEECARNVRYSEFSRIISSRNDLYAIAVAHNSDDNAETVILNILRGAGTHGAAGIPPVRGNIVRPLIRVRKSDIIFALESAQIPYVTDSTNLSSDYSRNYIRNEIMPALSRITDDPVRAFSRFSDNLRSDDELLDSLAADFLAGNAHARVEKLSSLSRPIFARVLKRMAGFPVCALAVREIALLLSKDNFSYTLGRGKSFVCERGDCYVCEDEGEIDYRYSISVGKTEISEYSSAFILSTNREDKTSSNVYKISIQADISSAIIVGELYLRPRREGDTIYYGGITRKLKKLYNDRKIPKSKRALIPVLCDDVGVVWLPGFGVRRDRDPSTEERLYATLLVDTESSANRFYLGNEFKS